MDDQQLKQSPVSPSQGGEPSADPLKACEALRDEYLGGWKRAAADLANYKKDEAKRLEEFLLYGTAKIMKEILPVLDSFSLALASSPEDKGLLLIRSQLDDFLRKQNMERIKVSPGDAVDLNVHEPVLGEEGNIIEELSPGYRHNGRVIRAAKVRIGK